MKKVFEITIKALGAVELYVVIGIALVSIFK